MSADGRILLTMNDISFKILADTTMKESENISFVTTQAINEMLDPL